MAMREGHKLLGHDQDAHAHAIEHGISVHVNGVVIYPVDEVLDLLDKGVIDGGHPFKRGVVLSE